MVSGVGCRVKIVQGFGVCHASSAIGATGASFQTDGHLMVFGATFTTKIHKRTLSIRSANRSCKDRIPHGCLTWQLLRVHARSALGAVRVLGVCPRCVTSAFQSADHLKFRDASVPHRSIKKAGGFQVQGLGVLGKGSEFRV